MIKARQYGSLMMQRGTCSLCGDFCLVCGDGTSSCCNAECTPIEQGSIKRETQDKERRRQPNRYAQKNILLKQDNKCFWCGREFGEYVLTPKKTLYQLKPIWDHYIPYSFTQSCRNDQFVASCNRCNAHKGAKIVTDSESEEELREILKRRWYHGGWSDLP